jgi:hypothetical protein
MPSMLPSLEATVVDVPPQLAPPFNAQTLNDQGFHDFLWANYHQELADQANANAAQLAAIAVGVTDGSDAPAGNVGEYMTASATSVALSNAAVVNVVSLALTPGDWDVSGSVFFTAGAGTHSLFGAGIAGLDTYTAATFPTGAINQAMSTAVSRQSSAGAATVWLVARADFTGTVTASGTIRARRVR